MGCCSRLVGMTLHATIRPRKLFVENFLKKFPGTQKPPRIDYCQCAGVLPAIPNAEHLHYQNAAKAPTPHKRDEGHEKSRHVIGAVQDFSNVTLPTSPS